MGTPVFLFRLTLECGDFKLSGPWKSPDKQDQPGVERHMIGDITICEVCPLMPSDIYPYDPTAAVRLVVNVENLNPAGLRGEYTPAHRIRMDQLNAQHDLERKVLAEEYQNWRSYRTGQPPWSRPPGVVAVSPEDGKPPDRD